MSVEREVCVCVLVGGRERARLTACVFVVGVSSTETICSITVVGKLEKDAIIAIRSVVFSLK